MAISGTFSSSKPELSAAGLLAAGQSFPVTSSAVDGCGISLVACGDSVVCRNGEVVLLFDGRIDNYSDLPDAPRPDVPRSNSGNNPALLLNAYSRWGVDLPGRLIGDFSLAVWDSHESRLLLARDAGGCRPLHYWSQGKQFRFASEARALLARGDISTQLDERKIAHWLTRIPETAGATFFKNIWSVPPGHTLVWERERVTLHDHWKPETIPLLRLRDPREYAEGLRAALGEATRARIPLHSQSGSHLSGGLDSGSVTATAAMIASERGVRLTAFTAVPSVSVDDSRFPGRFCNETAHASATAAFYPNIDHVLIQTNCFPVFEVLDLMSSAAECPQLNPGNSVWFYGICAEASRRGVSTLVTGSSGNFTISYDGRRAISSLLANGRFLSGARLVAALRRRGWSWRSILRLAGRPLLPSYLRNALNEIRGIQTLQVEDATGLRPEFAQALDISPQGAIESAEMRDGRALRIWSLRRNDFGGHISALKQLTGVEQTDPTSDRRVVDFCLSVPEEHYFRDGNRRSLIKDAMAGRMPAKVLEERRIGRQSADFLVHLTRERDEIREELKRLRQSDLAARCLDLARLEQLAQDWPQPPYGHKEYNRYGTQLMRGISMGRFIRRVEDGSIFRKGD